MDNKNEYTTTPKRPYLVRAYYDWLLDNELTPYLIVDATYYGVDVPQEYVKNGQIVLNISPRAVGNLTLGNDFIEFSARFNGDSRNIVVPVGAAIALYARENSDGIMFEPEPIYEEVEKHNRSSSLRFSKKSESLSEEKNEKKAPTKSTSHLRIIK